jgi:hypothetical protein
MKTLDDIHNPSVFATTKKVVSKLNEVLILTEQAKPDDGKSGKKN